MPKQTRIVTTASGDYEVDVDVPTASVPDDTFSKGFHEGLKKEPVAGGLVGFGEAFPAGLAKGAWDTIKFPLTAIKGIVGGTAALATDPVGTLTSLRDSIVDLPAHAKKAFDDAIELASTDPEGWGKAVGTVTGGIEGGIATSRIPLKPGIRVAGKAMQYAGEHPFVARMSGGAMVGRGMIKGDPLTIGAGVATMGVPALLTKTGKALREFSGEDLSTALPSGARTIDVGDTSKLGKGVRLAPPQGPAPVGAGRVAYGGPAAEVAPALKESGARTIDVGDISGLETPAPVGAAPVEGVRTAIPGSSTGPAPYRPAARAAQKAEDLATKAAELKKQTATMETAGSRITTSETGVTEGGERVTSSKTFKPAGGEGEGAAAAGEKPIMVGGRMIDPNNPDTRRLYDLALKAQTEGTPGAAGVRLSGAQRRGTPLQTAMQDATEAEVNANAAVRGTPGDVPATPAAQRLEAERKAVTKGVRMAPPATDTADDLFTRMKDHRADIERLGTHEDSGGLGLDAEDTGVALKKQYPEVYQGFSKDQMTTAVRTLRQGESGLASGRHLKALQPYIDAVETPADARALIAKGGPSGQKLNTPTINAYKHAFHEKFGPGWETPEE